ncbi:MAG: tRNA preQ1(34) S-adenosylmethionine ribosyltransferase-isomerase QueA [Leptospiraceae bacterium]|nr:tRNA preQ1(34) S-adenosylmethionine ribosyltransferase-isomerase QueA [Leptospiraceae bacterium]
MTGFDLGEFDFQLDDALIAKYPVEKRDESRLMIVNRRRGEIFIEPFFRNIQNHLFNGDLLVFNKTRVSKRRAFLLDDSNRQFEVLFLEKTPDGNSWLCLIKNLRKLKNNDTLSTIYKDYQFRFTGRDDSYGILRPLTRFDEADFENFGVIPIPPYFKRESEKSDEERYQTVYGEVPGSVAAPTAGLHFTNELIRNLTQHGVATTSVELKISYGTFSPVTEGQILKKKLHPEMYYISKDSADALNRQKSSGKRICAVGTTTLRVLETAFDKKRKTFAAGSDSTDLFIFPEDKINSIDALITNFHLPKSSLLLLVCAFAGKNLIFEAYKKAISEKMRFFSYGDSMLIL